MPERDSSVGQALRHEPTLPGHRPDLPTSALSGNRGADGAFGRWAIMGDRVNEHIVSPAIASLAEHGEPPAEEPGGRPWRRLPGWSGIREAEFADPNWQERNAVTRPEQLRQLLDLVSPPGFLADVEAGLKQAPMALRVTPYILSLINWTIHWSTPYAGSFCRWRAKWRPLTLCSGSTRSPRTRTRRSPG